MRVLLVVLALSLASCMTPPLITGSGMSGETTNAGTIATAPPMDEKRTKVAQDCRQTVDLTRGNLLCQ